MWRLSIDAVLYADLWKDGITDGEMSSFSSILSKFLGIDPKAPTIMGTMCTVNGQW